MVDGSTVESVNDVVVEVPTGLPLRSTVYDATPLSSLDAAQDMSTFEVVTPDATGLPGAVGGWSAGGVVEVAGLSATVWAVLIPDVLEVAVVGATWPEAGTEVSASSPVILYVVVDGVPDSPRSVQPVAGVTDEATAMPAKDTAVLDAVPVTPGIAMDLEAALSETAEAPTGVVGSAPAYVAVVHAADCDEDSLNVSVAAGVAVVATRE